MARFAGGTKRLTAQDAGAQIDRAPSRAGRFGSTRAVPFHFMCHELAVGEYVNEATAFPETSKTDAFPTEVPPPIS